MLRVVTLVCANVHGLSGHVALTRVQFHVSLFLLDLYRLSLSDALQIQKDDETTGCALVPYVTSKGFGKRFSVANVVAALTVAAAQNRWVILQLLDDYSGGQCFKSDYDNDRILCAAASNGHLKIVQWIGSRCPTVSVRQAMVQVARNGHLAVVAFLWPQFQGQGLRKSFAQRKFTTLKAVRQAAGGGHLSVVEFFVHHNAIDCVPCVQEKALCGGHLEVVAYLDTLGTPPIATISPTKCAKAHVLSSSASTAQSLTSVVRLHSKFINAGLVAFEWLAIHRPQLTLVDSSLLGHVVMLGKVDLVEWAFAQLPHEAIRQHIQKVVEASCVNDDVNVLKWFMAHGLVPKCLDVSIAVRLGYVDQIKLLLQHSPAVQLMCSASDALRSGNEEMIDLFVLSPLSCHHTTVDHIALLGNARLFARLLRDCSHQREAILRSTLRIAINEGKMALVQYLYTQFPTCETIGLRLEQLIRHLYMAGCRRYHELVRFVLEQERPRVQGGDSLTSPRLIASFD